MPRSPWLHLVLIALLCGVLALMVYRLVRLPVRSVVDWVGIVVVSLAIVSRGALVFLQTRRSA